MYRSSFPLSSSSSSYHKHTRPPTGAVRKCESTATAPREREREDPLHYSVALALKMQPLPLSRTLQFGDGSTAQQHTTPSTTLQPMHGGVFACVALGCVRARAWTSAQGAQFVCAPQKLLSPSVYSSMQSSVYSTHFDGGWCDTSKRAQVHACLTYRTHRTGFERIEFSEFWTAKFASTRARLACVSVYLRCLHNTA